MNGQSTKPDGKAIIQTCFKTDKRFDDVNKYTKGCGDQIVSVRKRKLHQAGTQAGTKAGTKEGAEYMFTGRAETGALGRGIEKE